MTKNEIINAYGEPASINKRSISYNFKNKTLSFMLENNIIKSIILDENIM